MIILNDDLKKEIKKYLETKKKDTKIRKEPKSIFEKRSSVDSIIKMELRKLTEKQKQKIIYVFDDFASEYFVDEASDSEYVTAYDILMKQKEEEFKNHLLEDNEPYQIEALLEMCDEYIKEKETQEHPFSAFAFIIMYDMWLNKSPVWPVSFNPEWERWNKLKAVKVKRKKVDD